MGCVISRCACREVLWHEDIKLIILEVLCHGDTILTVLEELGNGDLVFILNMVVEEFGDRDLILIDELIDGLAIQQEVSDHHL